MRYAGMLFASLVVGSPAFAQAPGSWTLLDRTDAVNDTRNVQIISPATEVQGVRGEAYLAFVCVGAESRVVVAWPTGIKRIAEYRQYGVEAGEITHRFPPAGPVQGPWAIFSGGRFTMAQRPNEFLSEALGAESAVFRALSVFDQQITLRFDLGRLKSSIAPVLAACDWGNAAVPAP